MVDSDDYDHRCKHCKAKPFVPGPQHANTCERWRPTPARDSEEANRYSCKHCGVKPFVAGSHHKAECPRYESEIGSYSPSCLPGGTSWHLQMLADAKGREIERIKGPPVDLGKIIQDVLRSESTRGG